MLKNNGNLVSTANSPYKDLDLEAILEKMRTQTGTNSLADGNFTSGDRPMTIDYSTGSEGDMLYGERGHVMDGKPVTTRKRDVSRSKSKKKIKGLGTASNNRGSRRSLISEKSKKSGNRRRSPGASKLSKKSKKRSISKRSKSKRSALSKKSKKSKKSTRGRSRSKAKRSKSPRSKSPRGRSRKKGSKMAGKGSISPFEAKSSSNDYPLLLAWNFDSGNRRNVDNERWLDNAGVYMSSTGTMRLKSGSSRRFMSPDNKIFHMQEKKEKGSKKRGKSAKSRGKSRKGRSKSKKKSRGRSKSKGKSRSKSAKSKKSEKEDNRPKSYRSPQPRHIEGFPPIDGRVQGDEPKVLYPTMSPEAVKLMKMHAVLQEQIRIRE